MFGSKKAIDPVCGMKIAVDKAEHIVKHGDNTFYFCSEGCKKAFVENPKRYIDSVEKTSGHEVSNHDVWRCC